MSDTIPTIVFDGNPAAASRPEHLKLHASLTTLDSEDWIVVPDKNRVLIVALREQRSKSGTVLTLSRSGWCHRTAMLRVLQNLPVKHDLGVISVYVTTDADEQGTNQLLSEVFTLGKRKSFNVLSAIMPTADTKQCVRCLAPTSSPSQDFVSAPVVATALS